MYGERVGREYRAPFPRDNTVQQTWFQSSSTIDLASGTRLHLPPSHLPLLIVISRRAHPWACVPSGKRCQVSRVMWHVGDGAQAARQSLQKTHEFCSDCGPRLRLAFLRPRPV